MPKPRPLAPALRYHADHANRFPVSGRRIVSAPNLTPLGDQRRPIMVVSHERSGTHFMMNTLAACFGYVSRPWLDIDRHQFNINYFHPPSVQQLITRLAALRAANLIKSHHEFAFFSESSSSFDGAIHVIYIYRNPADVMASFWRFLHSWPWVEGPKAETAADFATAPPMGQLMRYQFRQHETMLDRWANHVQHWLQASATSPQIHVVKYEDLANGYESTVRRLGNALGCEPRQVIRPAREQNVVQAGPVKYEPAPDADNRAAVSALASEKYPELMTRLGYG